MEVDITSSVIFAVFCLKIERQLKVEKNWNEIYDLINQILWGGFLQ